MPMLRVEDLVVAYGRIVAVRGVNLEVASGEIVGVIGANGAGKTTTLAAIAGVKDIRAGRVLLEGRGIEGAAPEQIVANGVALVPEGRRIFGTLSVEENLRIPTFRYGNRKQASARLADIYEQFPVLWKYRKESAGQLSGGEQQQLAIGRALLCEPRLLLLDEPSVGLAPRLVDEVLESVARLREQGTTILLVEQNGRRTVELADRTYIMRAGEIVLSGTREEFARGLEIEASYLGFDPLGA